MAEELITKRCRPCEGGMPAMKPEEANRYLSQAVGWELIEEKKIKKEFKFKRFQEALDFVNKIGALAEEEQHHPTITIAYNKVRIILTTHAIEGLSENDFIMAAKINQIK